VNISINWTQHPVGHGGFHTGIVHAHGDALTWMFDCGSRSGARFDSYLRRWIKANGRALDWLFLSHFDKDHVSGLETLFALVEVRDVMLPYVNEAEMALLLLRDISKGGLDRAMFEMASDPTAFFMARGVERVTYVDPAGPDATEDAEPGPKFDPDLAGTWITRIKPPPREIDDSIQQDAAKARDGKVRRMSSGGTVVVERSGFAMRFVPYRAPIVGTAHAWLLQNLKKLVGYDRSRSRSLNTLPGLGRLAYAIAAHARTPSGRASLKALYAAYATSSNRASMSVMSAPLISRADARHVQLTVSGPILTETSLSEAVLAAWMNTGDAELLNSNDLMDWRFAYARDLPDVRVLALPHHGSDRNSDGDLQTLCPKALLTAQAKDGARKHPGDVVSTAAVGRLATVTWDPGTKVSMALRAW
jgi:hypothetical protein